MRFYTNLVFHPLLFEDDFRLISMYLFALINCLPFPRMIKHLEKPEKEVFVNQSPEIWGVFQKLTEKLRKGGNDLYVP